MSIYTSRDTKEMIHRLRLPETCAIYFYTIFGHIPNISYHTYDLNLF
jgi:hypothetical protein